MHVRINVTLCSYVHSIYFSHKLHQECILQSTVMVIRCPPMVSDHFYVSRDNVAEVCLLYPCNCNISAMIMQLLKKLMHVELAEILLLHQ